MSQVYDVRALRLIVATKQDCYAALREVERLWPSVPGRFKVIMPSCQVGGWQELRPQGQLGASWGAAGSRSSLCRKLWLCQD